MLIPDRIINAASQLLICNTKWHTTVGYLWILNGHSRWQRYFRSLQMEDVMTLVQSNGQTTLDKNTDVTWLRRYFTFNNCHHDYHKTRHTRENGKRNNGRILDDENHWHITTSQLQIQHARQNVCKQWTADSTCIGIRTKADYHITTSYSFDNHNQKISQLVLHCHLRPPVKPVIMRPTIPAYQLSAILDSQWLNYSKLTISNVGTVLNIGYDWKWILTILQPPAPIMHRSIEFNTVKECTTCMAPKERMRSPYKTSWRQNQVLL